MSLHHDVFYNAWSLALAPARAQCAESPSGHRAIESQNHSNTESEIHRILEWFGFERALKINQFQLPVMDRKTFL